MVPIDESGQCRRWRGLQPIQRARRAARRHLEHMGVDHGGAYVGMAKQLLHGADVGAGLQEVGGEGVAQGVWRGRFWNACRLQCLLECTLKGLVVGVVPAHDFAAWVC